MTVPLRGHVEIDVEGASRQLASRPAAGVVEWAVSRFGNRFVIATAFQAEGMVILDLAHRVDPGVRVITLDTGRLPQQTHDFIDVVRARYGIEVEVVVPKAEAVAAPRRDREAEPSGRVVERSCVGLCARQRCAGPPAVRQGVCEHRLRAVHPTTAAGRG